MRLLYWAASLVLLGLLSLHSVPYVARDFVVYSLLQQGADEAKLKRVSIDWLTAKIALQGLEVRHEEASVLNVRRLDFDIYLKELLDDRIRLSGLRLEGADLQLRQQDQLILLGPIVLAGQASEPQEPSSESSYEFGSDLIELVDIDIKLLQPQGAQSLNVQRLNVGGLYQWSPLDSTDIRFVGHLNGAPITIDSSALPLPERKTVSVNLALRQLELTPLLMTLEPQLAATLDANLSIEVAVEGYNAWISQSGTLGLNDVSAVSDLGMAELGSLRWQGESKQQLNLAEGAELLEQLSLKGLLGAQGLKLSQDSQSLELGSLELQPDLQFIPAEQQLSGALSMTLGELLAKSEQGQVQLGSLVAEAPMLGEQGGLAIQLDINEVNAQDSNSNAASVEKLTSKVNLSHMAGAPLWHPQAADIELALTGVSAESAEAQVNLGSLQLTGETSSLEQLDRVSLKGKAETLDLESAELISRLSGLDLDLAYVAADEKLNLRLNFTEPSLIAGTSSLSGDQILAQFDGVLPLGLAWVDAEIGLSAESLQLSQEGQAFSFEQLSLSGPVDMRLPEESQTMSADVLQSANLQLQLAKFSAEGTSLNGVIEQASAKSQFESASGDTSVQLNLSSVDLKTPELGMRATNPTLSLVGQVQQQERLQADLKLATDAVAVARAGDQYSWQSLSFMGPVDLALDATLAEQPLSLSGPLNLSGFSAQLADGTEASLAKLSGDLDLNQQESLAVSAGVDLQGLQLKSSGQSVSLAGARLDPKLTFNQVLAQLDPTAVAGSLSARFKEFGLQSDGRDIGLGSLVADLSLSAQGSSQKLQGSLSSNDISVVQGDQSAQVQRIELKPNLQRTETGIQLSTPVNLQSAGYSDVQQQVSVEQLSSDANLQLGETFDLQRLAIGSTSLTQLSVTGEQPVKLEQARVQGVSLSANQAISLEQLQLNGLTLGPAEAPMLALNSLALDSANFADNYLQLGTLITNDLLANLKSELKAAPAAEQTDTAAGGTAEQASSGSEAPASDKRLPIDISLQGWQAQGRTELSYRDASLVAPLNLKLVASQISAGTWDSRLGKVLPLKLRAKLNDSADISLDANITPLRTKPNGDWKVSISALPMPILSPLVQTFAGYQIRSGSLNLDSSGTLNEGQLKGNNAVRIQRLEVQRAQNSAADETDKMFTMPLPSAVALLETDDRTIKLDLPVSGDINDPKFNYQDVIQIVVTKGVKEGAMAYLTNSLQPFGAIFMVYGLVKDANDTGRFIQLQPLEFDPASADLNQNGRDYAAKLAGMMQDRPSLTLEICPVTLVTEERLLWDRMVEEQKTAEAPLPETELGALWDQKIAELAAGRIESLRSVLVRVGVANERIFPCIARSGVTEGTPRVELAF